MSVHDWENDIARGRSQHAFTIGMFVGAAIAGALVLLALCVASVAFAGSKATPTPDYLMFNAKASGDHTELFLPANAANLTFVLNGETTLVLHADGTITFYNLHGVKLYDYAPSKDAREALVAQLKSMQQPAPKESK